jgi:hypothetical protein
MYKESMISDGRENSSEVISLPPVQIEMILRADEAFRNGEKGLSPEEVMDRARAKVEEWTKILPSQSA